MTGGCSEISQHPDENRLAPEVKLFVFFVMGARKRVISHESEWKRDGRTKLTSLINLRCDSPFEKVNILRRSEDEVHKSKRNVINVNDRHRVTD